MKRTLNLDFATWAQTSDFYITGRDQSNLKLGTTTSRRNTQDVNETDAVSRTCDWIHPDKDFDYKTYAEGVQELVKLWLDKIVQWLFRNKVFSWSSKIINFLAEFTRNCVLFESPYLVLYVNSKVRPWWISLKSFSNSIFLNKLRAIKGYNVYVLFYFSFLRLF